MMHWRDELEVGDKVIVERGSGSTLITTVVRITKTRQITVDGVEGRFKDGVLMGSGHGYSSYTRITEWTQEKQDEIVAARNRSRLLRIFDSASFDVLTDEEVETISNIFQKHIEEQTSARKGDIVTYSGKGRYYDRKEVTGCKIISAPRFEGKHIVVNLDKVGHVDVKKLLWE